jgi:regulator of protease activity HflC (stomatin/prohibitin superfamily)
MFGIRYLKTAPTEYVLHYANGALQHNGAGMAFFYFQPTATIALVPSGSADAPFIFNEMTADFQPVTVQGALTYRIADPARVAALLNYTIDLKAGAARTYASDDPDKLPLRVTGMVQEATRAQVQSRALRAAIQSSDDIAARVLETLKTSAQMNALGLEVLALTIAAIKPSPEMARALEAETRETLLRQSDDAIYTRRNNAVEQERLIKENELRTDIAVEEKKRQIRETKVAADLAIGAREQEIREAKLQGDIRLEDERKRLVAARADNARADADAQAYALAATLRVFQLLDPALVQALSMQSADPRVTLGLALKEIAANAGKIGQFNFTPDLMAALADK